MRNARPHGCWRHRGSAQKRHRSPRRPVDTYVGTLGARPRFPTATPAFEGFRYRHPSSRESLEDRGPDLEPHNAAEIVQHLPHPDDELSPHDPLDQPIPVDDQSRMMKVASGTQGMPGLPSRRARRLARQIPAIGARTSTSTMGRRARSREYRAPSHAHDLLRLAICSNLPILPTPCCIAG